MGLGSAVSRRLRNDATAAPLFGAKLLPLLQMIPQFFWVYSSLGAREEKRPLTFEEEPRRCSMLARFRLCGSQVLHEFHNRVGTGAIIDLAVGSELRQRMRWADQPKASESMSIEYAGLAGRVELRQCRPPSRERVRSGAHHQQQTTPGLMGASTYSCIQCYKPATYGGACWTIRLLIAAQVSGGPAGCPNPLPEARLRTVDI